MVPSGSRVFRAVLVPAAFRSWALVIHDDWCHIVGCESEMMMPLPPPHHRASPPAVALTRTAPTTARDGGPACLRSPPRHYDVGAMRLCPVLLPDGAEIPRKKKRARLFCGQKRGNRHEDLLLLSCAPASRLMCRNDSANRWVVDSKIPSVGGSITHANSILPELNRLCINGYD
jgi:hypothetical protein